MKKLVVFAFFLTSCATLKNEQDHYDYINKTVIDEKYSLAIYHILAFESKYPESKQLCELWKLQENLYKKTEKEDFKYVEILKKKEEERCK